MHPGERLEEERLRLGKPQSAMADQCGVTKRTQIYYEAGERFPDVPYLQKFAEAGGDVLYVVLGTRISALTYEPGGGAVGNSVAEATRSSREQTLVNGFRELDESGKRVIEQMIATLTAAKKG